MTIDERTITRALRTYAQGFDLTDTDLDRLEERLEQRLHGHAPSELRRSPLLAVAACAVTALVVATTALWRTGADQTLPAAPTAPGATMADLAGVWVVNEQHSWRHLWHFTADGGRSATGDPFKLVAMPEDGFEPYSVAAGGVVSFDVDGAECRATARISAEGRMTLTPLGSQPRCPFSNGQPWSLTRVSPVSVAGAAILERPFAGPPEPAHALTSVNEVWGTWLLQGTGTVLAIAPTSSDRGEYVVDDDGDSWAQPDQRGTFTFDPDGGLVLHPAEGAGQGCDSDYDVVLTTGVTLEMKLADSSCGRVGGTRSTWIRLN